MYQPLPKTASEAQKAAYTKAAVWAGRALIEALDPHAAMAAITAALQATPGDDQAVHFRAIAHAKVAALSPDKDAKQAAIESIDQAIDNKPTSDLYMTLGELHMALGQPTEAAAAFGKAVNFIASEQ